MEVRTFTGRSKMFLSAVMVVGILGYSATVCRAAATLPLKAGARVLFIGNSLTAKLPVTVNNVLKANNLPQFEGYRLQIWNQGLQTHWTFTPATHPNLMGPGENGYKIKGASTLYKQGQYNTTAYTNKGYILALEAIKNGAPDGKPWDFVVLQDYGIGDKEDLITKTAGGTLSSSGKFYTYAMKFIEEIRKVGAQPVFYMHWVLNPDKVPGGGVTAPYWLSQVANTESNYKLLAKAEAIPLVPVGAVMHRLCTTLKPSGKSAGWLFSDNVHPNDMGKSLQDYCFAAAFSGKSASTLKYFETVQNATDDASIKAAITQVFKEYEGTVALRQRAVVSSSATTPLVSAGRITIPANLDARLHNKTPRVSFTDVLGRRSYRNAERSSAGFVVDTRSLAPGQYLIRVENGDATAFSAKVVLVR